MCMSEDSMKRRVVFAYLEEIKRLWRKEFAGIEQTALAFSLNDRFCPVLQHEMVSCKFMIAESHPLVDMFPFHRIDLILILERTI